MFTMKFGHGLVLATSRGWGSAEFSAWQGRVVESVGRWCYCCREVLGVGEQVVVVERVGELRRFYHLSCTPIRIRAGAAKV